MQLLPPYPGKHREQLLLKDAPVEAVVDPAGQELQLAFFNPSPPRKLPLRHWLQVVPSPPQPATHRVQEVWPVPSVV